MLGLDVDIGPLTLGGRLCSDTGDVSSLGAAGLRHGRFAVR